MAGQQPQPPSTEPPKLAEIANNPLYIQLVQERSRLAWTLTSIMLAIFFGYILLIAFAPELLASRIGGGSTTLGIPLGLGVIAVGIVLTGIYVHRANSRFDSLTRQIVDERDA